MEKSPGVDVFAYQDFREFLRDYYSERRKRDRKFSIRFFARRAGLRSQNYLKVVMDGKRSLTVRNIPKFIRGLGLDRGQAEYFETLVNLNQARDSVERREHLYRLELLQKKQAAVKLTGVQLDFFNHWYNVVIFEMACQAGFSPDPNLISLRLGGTVSVEEINASLELMLATGILRLSEEGRYIPVAAQLASPEEVPNDTLRRLHDDFLRIGLAHPSREVHSLTIALTPDQEPQFKAKVKEFIREMNTLYSSGRGTDIFQFNVQLFKIASPPKQK